MNQTSLEDILKKATLTIQAASDLKLLDECRVQLLGKKGLLTELLKTLGQLPPEERPAAGQKINVAKDQVQHWIEARAAELKKSLIDRQLAEQTIDVTLQGRIKEVGSIHPISKTMNELRAIFVAMGFTMLAGPEIEDDGHNFTALNIPPLHPARAMQDTFYFPNGLLLRTHMSPVQIRILKQASLPLRVAAMGRVYRRDFDLTHTPMFHQMEVLMVDQQVTFADLKGMVQHFLQQFFFRDIKVRIRPSYFPFTEPSAEADIGCLNCKAKGCRICKQTGWLEVLGCGMVHPHVLKLANIDQQSYRGFAIGAGIDRLTMLKYGITDLRSLFENDLRFLKQF